MSSFLRFLIAAYAPLAARHMLVDGQCMRRIASHPAKMPKPRFAEFSACIDIASRLRRPSTPSDGLTSLYSMAQFVPLDDLDMVEHTFTRMQIVKPRHRTFYGSSELNAPEPGGNVAGFAQFG